MLPDGVPSAAVAAGGGIIGSALSYADAQRARQWQERMARNAVQYRVEDLRKANINPILAAGAGLGGGLSVPGTAVANPGDFGASAGVQALNTSRLTKHQAEGAKHAAASAGFQAALDRMKYDWATTPRGREALERQWVTEGKSPQLQILEFIGKGAEQLWDAAAPSNSAKDKSPASDRYLDQVESNQSSARTPATLPLSKSPFLDGRKVGKTVARDGWEPSREAYVKRAYKLWKAGHLPGEHYDQFYDQAKRDLVKEYEASLRR